MVDGLEPRLAQMFRDPGYVTLARSCSRTESRFLRLLPELPERGCFEA